MEFLIVTGLSGAGKTRAMHALEDIGFYCVDNIPPTLLPTFYDLCGQSKDAIPRVAVVTDVRGGDLFGTFFDELSTLRQENKEYKILYLDAQDDVLIRRYKETRRNHPLAAAVSGSVEGAILEERERLKPIRARADYIIDTSFLSNAQLKEKISSLFLEDSSEALIVNCISFGFKYGTPSEADLMFDVRCFPNPFYVDSLRPKNGLDKEVQEYVMQAEESKEFSRKLFDMIDYLLPLYCDEGKSQLVVAVGCTGGKHRSVTFAQLLYEHLLARGVKVRVQHRDICKP